MEDRTTQLQPTRTETAHVHLRLGQQAATRMAGLARQASAHRISNTQSMKLTNASRKQAETSSGQVPNRPGKQPSEGLLGGRRIAGLPASGRRNDELVQAVSGLNRSGAHAGSPARITEDGMAAGSPSLIISSARTPSVQSASSASRQAVNPSPVTMDVPVKASVRHVHEEPVIRSLEVAIKTIEQDLNLAKEELAKPKLDVNRLADQMYKEFSKRMRQERQRKGI
ncbi:hypothetical protein [Paenibacillus sacheonensis]|uniref:Uncharacterized protein n=1 Tax=Paenibacillus sacheonensis TaxID=742054 RepID=A0A7X4YMZ6_9BACL|nr:hypothetical protein [Paenibacillus sacheonensis]NBC68526.1 hypothetical protein [Paenibacillus sacheonensis]